MKLTLTQQADFIEWALQSQRAHVDFLRGAAAKGKRPKEELALAEINLNGVGAALGGEA